VLTCSGGVATSEGTWQMKNYEERTKVRGYRGLAVFAWPHKDAHAVCGPRPGVNIN
jgi:hypothetical protein